MQPIELVLSKLPDVRKNGNGWSANCPGHDDQHPSLSIKRGDDGCVLLHCHAGCKPGAVCKAMGLRLADLFAPGNNGNSLGRVVATYDYRDANGKLLYQVLRYAGKQFRQRRPDGRGGWIWKLGRTPRVLYRLPELLAAETDEPVFVVEGEKDADRLASLGLTATTCSQGAGQWNKVSDDSALRNRRVAIIADKDEPGRKHAADVAIRLINKALEIRVIELPGDGKDASDWFDVGGTAEELRGLVEAAEDFSVPEAVMPVTGQYQPSKRRGKATKLVRTKTGQLLSGEPQPGTIDPASGRLILSKERTLSTAEAYVNQFHHCAEGVTLRHYAGLSMKWQGNRYVEIEDAALQHHLLPWLHAAVRMVYDKKTNGWVAQDYPANPHTVKAALESIKDYTFLKATTASPSWLDERDDRPNPCELLPCRSGLLHLPTMKVLTPTPAYFSVSALDYDHDPSAPQPTRWQAFLSQLFEDDLACWDLLQEWFGYCLTGDTSQHKILLIIGPRRSGKGTLARVLTRLVGASNVCGPTTSSLSGPFGLQPLIGKSLAIVSDARFSGRDVQTVVERLLCISGEDWLTIDRKHMTSVSMKLPTRFVFLTNELPRLTDASGALAGRFMMLRLTKSFYGREDKALTAQLLTELPGILNWAIEGRRQLRERGHFVQPASVDDALRDMEDLSSPVGAFVRERCDVGPGLRAWVNDIYQAWKSWCEADGRVKATTKQTFGRDLMAAAPGITTRVSTAARFYQGIALKGGLA